MILILITSFVAINISIVVGINHWILNDGRIIQKIDSPFYMREPDNLITFLEQIKYNDHVEKSYLDLLRQREQIVEHLLFSVQFGEDLVEQAKCAIDYYLMEKRMSYLKVTPAYVKRLNFPDLKDKITLSGEPICEGKINIVHEGPYSYDHLQGLQPTSVKFLNIEPEEEINIINKDGSKTETLRRMALDGLNKRPHNWKTYIISSYYWRIRGHGQYAIECARIGLMLVPREYKDIALLNLGTILFRANYLADAEIILTAAVEHAPDVSENHIVLASNLAMKHEFNRSLHHFDEAERLNPSLLPRTQHVRNFITCLDNLTKKTNKMFSYIEYIKNEVTEFKKLKHRIAQNHEKLLQRQVPIGVRYSDIKINDEELLKRGQYCSSRMVPNAKEPTLFCDFYSDMHMRLESKDVDIESLERELKLTSEAVMKQVSAELRRQTNLEKLKSIKAQIPVPLKDQVSKRAVS